MKNWLKILIIAICILIVAFLFFFDKKEQKPASAPINTDNNPVVYSPKSVDTSSWTNYSNSQLGFSIKIPVEVYGIDRCSSSHKFFVPLEIFEDNNNRVVYISEAYYYDSQWSEAEQRYTGNCGKITYSLQSLKDEENKDREIMLNNVTKYYNLQPFLGWRIAIADVENDEDILKFIKDNFGQGCNIGSKTASSQEGIYQVGITGEDWNEPGMNIGETTCLVNFEYRILYSPEKHKLMSVVLGQECKFGTDPSVPSSYQCYDNEMIDSFKFI
jgi:hypothetical protein